MIESVCWRRCPALGPPKCCCSNSFRTSHIKGILRRERHNKAKIIFPHCFIFSPRPVPTPTTPTPPMRAGVEVTRTDLMARGRTMSGCQGLGRHLRLRPAVHAPAALRGLVARVSLHGELQPQPALHSGPDLPNQLSVQARWTLRNVRRFRWGISWR